MSEYIITGKQLKTVTEAHSEREVPLPITNVFISGDKLPEIVRCRDCKRYHAEVEGCEEFAGKWPGEFANVEPDGYCAWAERRDA